MMSGKRTFLWAAGVTAAGALFAANLDAILASWQPVRIPYNPAALTARQRQMVDKLADACRYLDDIFWRQSDPEALRLYKTTADPKLRRLLMINGSRWDLLDDNRPFTGSEPMLPGHALYPADLTRAKLDAYLQQHPEDRKPIYDPYTVVRWNNGRLTATPYHVEYRAILEPAARDLRDAAAFSDDPAFAKFLRLRADALLSDDYYASDLAWLDLENPKIDIIFAPYETYLDDLLGVKTSYGAAVLIRNEPESARLAVFEKYIPEIQQALPAAPADLPSKRGHRSPMEVVDSPYRAGDLRHGYQAVADNLPNDPRIHETKGSKKIFFKNFMDARVDYVILPIARRLMRPDQAPHATGEGYFLGTLAHEISHGLGPAFARVSGKQVDIREAIGPAYSALEEAKADVVGMYALEWLARHNALTQPQLTDSYASYLAGLLRSLRFGAGEAHGRAEMMEFNYLSERKAILRGSDGRHAVDMARIPGALAALAKELLAIEATGDRPRAEAWFRRYEKMPAALAASLQTVKDIPVDLDPTFAFPDLVR
jgi:hypothetical protein